ncbi:MAG: SUF system Fe-S cluster assembly protein [Ignavibacteriales bacterium]|nr:SUF system Fe-S cluster assembly protein [Ignavibacteriales bacterium]MCF8316484.1 SUF system Fe-S cluster assembly protein [Ignavibacteriales bacterium]MCF8437964.1 SUF system Fe-S cluster assembly protein [Ignavibacteriales bacterium]
MFDKEKLESDIISALKTCYDPEIPVDIYELGLVYEIQLDAEGRVYIKMTLTSPACPVAGSLPGEVKKKVEKVKGVKDVYLDLVWNPPWDKDRMSEEAKLLLGFL